MKVCTLRALLVTGYYCHSCQCMYSTLNPAASVADVSVSCLIEYSCAACLCCRICTFTYQRKHISVNFPTKVLCFGSKKNCSMVTGLADRLVMGHFQKVDRLKYRK